ncbi:thioester reductase domain-containing protein [Pseudomonas paraeruginosa]|uniref:Amino acid adenylation domain-containing protein n=1 Tax=Pseudomonas aeruginosa TaxID=287 RepID=A0ABD7JYI5_PSEAI|nr:MULTISPECIES: thioester reductase domain-containing protein [Pseudomonas aeruginosa group]RTR93838.1 amino acid adenylation domain-containing protein [Pseudomonas paraeruginosa]RTS42514.1 amino acid adenylation domain-containing protein [Pseudomonas aeruginosa]
MSKDSVLGLFSQQAQSHPERLAIVDHARSLTYRELDRLSDRLAARLAGRGVGKGALLPLLAERSPELVIAILAAAKCAAAYVPVDRRQPDKRKQEILRQCRAPLVLATQAGELPGHAVETIAELLDQATRASPAGPEPGGSDALYVIFTSGTTGEPKGVVVESRSLANLVRWHNRRFEMSGQSRTTLMAGVGFDVSQWEIWSTLCAGACLHLVPEDVRPDPAALLAFFAEQRISHAFAPTVMVPALVERPVPTSLALHYLFCAGEKLPPVATGSLPYTLVDYYGPTEATVFATCRVVDAEAYRRPASIGLPIGGCEAFILDAEDRPCRGDTPGELNLAGICLARGYLNDPVMTERRFHHAPHLRRRLYRTGDRARWLADGSLQFLGRLDDQVKIRGNRVELGDVEAALLRQPAIHGAVVLAHADDSSGSQQLSAFVVPRERAVAPAALLAALKSGLRQELPDYMLPSRYLLLERLPTTANGKTDRQALRRSLAEHRHERLDTQRCETPDQLQAALAWQEVLGHNDFGLDDSFFDVGGHSLLAAALVRELSRRFGSRAYIHDVYRTPSVRQQAASLARRAGQAPAELDSEPAQELRQDVRLPEGLDFGRSPHPEQLQTPRHLLLTGATGLIGAHLLAELLASRDAELHCPVRAQSDAHALERLRQATRQYRIELAETDWRRVRAYAADLAEPGFGLPVETYRELAGSVDQVFHSASAVNFIQPYSYMKRDNVQGLEQVLRFCACGQAKPLMLLSSISVYSWGHLHTGKRLMREDDDLDQNLPAVLTDMGYVRSKWVMEKIADLAAERGLALMTFRLGYATCHSRSGAHADYQWWSRLARTCLEYRAVPLLRELREGLTTVDYMVGAISAIARQPTALGKKFNLVPSIPRCLTLEEFFARLGERAGQPLRPMPFHDWVSLWEENRDAPLHPLLSMFRDNMYAGRSTVELYQDTYLWDCANVEEHLRGSGIREPEFDARLLDLYLASLTGAAATR